jgi:hypothetical protein
MDLSEVLKIYKYREFLTFTNEILGLIMAYIFSWNLGIYTYIKKLFPCSRLTS